MGIGPDQEDSDVRQGAPEALPNTTVPATVNAGDSVLGSSRFTRRY